MAGKGFYIRVDDNSLGRFNKGGLDAATDAARKACALGASVAKAQAPKGKTGKLAGSIKVGVGGQGSATIEAGVPYAVYQEFGVAGRYKGHHFMRAGITAAQKAWPSIMDRSMPG